MHIIELDGRNWRTVVDFYDALLTALRAPDWHGRSVGALIDSMIWGGINAVEPPYTIRLSSTGELPKEITDELEILKRIVPVSCAEFRVRKGHEVDVRFEIIS
jgi:hypothetical protein